MAKFNERLREVLQDTRTFLDVILDKETLSPTAVVSKETLLQKLQQLQQDVPHLFFSLDLSEAARRQVRPLSSPHPYLDMQPGVPSSSRTSATRPVPEEPSPEYVYSDTLVQPVESTAQRNVDERMAEEGPGSEEESLLIQEEERGDEGSTVADVPGSELLKAEKTGFLEKKGKDRLGGLLSTSQKRWCAIRGGILYMYDRPTDKRQKDQILLANYEARPFVYATKDATKRDAGFEIVCPGKRTYQFIAFNGKDMKQWISAIERNNKGAAFSSQKEQASERASPSAPTKQISKRQTPPPPSSVSPIGKPPAALPQEPDFDLSYECVDAVEEEEPLYEDGESYVGQGQKMEDEEVEGSKEDWYVALWDCVGSRSDELSFRRGDLLKIVGKEYDADAWWIGSTRRGKVGFVPKAYLTEAFEKVEE